MSRRGADVWFALTVLATLAGWSHAAEYDARWFQLSSTSPAAIRTETSSGLDEYWQQLTPQALAIEPIAPPDALQPPAPPPTERDRRRLISRSETDAPGSAHAVVDPDGDRGNWGRSALSLALVVGLIGLLAWGYRAMASGGPFLLRGRGRRAGLIELVSRTSLSPRQSLCLVRIGPRLVLVGVCPESIRALHAIEDPELTAQLAGQAAARSHESQVAAFERCLTVESNEYEASRGDAEPATSGSDAPLRLHQRLSDTLRRLKRAVG